MIVVGFQDEAKLVRAIAKRLRAKAIFASASSYRAGEIAILGPMHASRHCAVVTDITEDPRTMFRAGALSEALRDAGARRVDLVAPWIAYGRQDRATRRGEAAAGRVVGKMLSLVFDRVITLDAHSPEFMKSFRGKLANVLPMTPLVARRTSCVAAPDRGATSRAHHAASSLGVPLVVVEKKRVKGRVVASRLDAKEQDIKGTHVLLVDDIADSGETLRNALCVLKAAGAARVSVAVTHAVHLAELRAKYRGMFDRIDAAYDHATGNITDAALRVLAAQAQRA